MDSKIKWQSIKWFDPEEFDDPHFPGSGEMIDGMLLFQLNRLRQETGWPIIPHGTDDNGNQVGGCVDVRGEWGHADNSLHLLKNGAIATDWHFITDESPRFQALMVEKMGFPGVGFYYDWWWNGKLLPLGFHTDMRPRDRAQRWTRRKGEYLYWWGRNY